MGVGRVEGGTAEAALPIGESVVATGLEIEGRLEGNPPSPRTTPVHIPCLWDTFNLGVEPTAAATMLDTCNTADTADTADTVDTADTAKSAYTAEQVGAHILRLKALLAPPSSSTTLDKSVEARLLQLTAKPSKLTTVKSGVCLEDFGLVPEEHEEIILSELQEFKAGYTMWDTAPGFVSTLIQLTGEAVTGEELVVKNVKHFNRLQWQRVEAVEQADGSITKFVEAIAENENKARYRVTPIDEGCSIRIVVSLGGSLDEVYGRDTPVVMAPRRISVEVNMTSVRDEGDGMSNIRAITKRIRRRMGIQAAKAAVTEIIHLHRVEVTHEQSQIDFLSSALSKHFLFMAVDKDTLENVCKSMQYVKIPAGSNVIQQGQIGDSFYVVDSGELQVIIGTEGHDEVKTLKTLRRGQCFGESVLMTVSMRRDTSVRAVVDCSAWVMHKSVYIQSVLSKSVGSSIEEFLKGVDIFYRLSPAVVRGLATKCESLEFPANTIIFQKGDFSNDMYFIVEGHVAITDGDGSELSTYTTHGSFGAGAILTGKGRRTAGAVTRTVTLCLKLPASTIITLFPLGVESLLDEKLVEQVLKLIPGFEQLTPKMLRDCGVTEDDAVLRSITLKPGALMVEERKPAEAIFIIKRGGLMVNTRKEQKLGKQPHRLSERAHFGASTAVVAKTTYSESAFATEELTQVLRLPAAHLRLLHQKCSLAARVVMLKKVPLLSTPSASRVLKSLAAASSIATFDEGSFIMGDGQQKSTQNDCENFFIIESGFANVYKMTSGDDPTTRQMRISARLGIGDYFGERVLLDPISQLNGEDGDMSNRESVVAITDVQCIVLSRSSFDAHIGALRGIMLTELSAMVDGAKV